MLELSTTAGYALLALGYLEKTRERWVLAREIAEQTGVAAPYLSRILYNLVKAGIVVAKRGYRGGFRLARPGSEIAILDIVDAVEHQPRVPRCLLGLPECSDQTACPVHLLWKTARARVESTLAQLTLDRVAQAVSERDARAMMARAARKRNFNGHDTRSRSESIAQAGRPSRAAPARKRRSRSARSQQP